jgi:hypothetical protein
LILDRLIIDLSVSPAANSRFDLAFDPLEYGKKFLGMKNNIQKKSKLTGHGIDNRKYFPIIISRKNL